MTALTTADPAEDTPLRLPRVERREVVRGLAVALPLLVWGLPLTHGTGGREPWVLSLGLLSLVPALVLLKPWRMVPGWQMALAMSPSLASLLVCLTAPTHWDGLDEFAGFAYAGGLFVVVRSYASGAWQRHVVLVLVALVGLEQFTQAYLPWWGGQSVDQLMVGTFYWHNQFAAYMLGAGLVAMTLAARGTGAVRLAGWLTAPWCIAAILFAGSRASLAAAVLLAALAFALALRDRRGRVASALVIAAGLGLATLLTSPLLMTDSGGLTSTVQAREASQTTEGNGRARLHLWRAAVDLGMERPLRGAGFDTFASAGSSRIPAATRASTYVHNGYLQAFSDGGVVLLAALAAATVVPLLAAVRALLVPSRSRADEVTTIGVGLPMVGLFLHSGVDFDWTYPALLGLFAVLAALVPAGSVRPMVGPHRRAPVAATAVVAMVLAIALPAAARATALESTGVAPPWWVTVSALGVPTSGEVAWLPAGELCRAALRAEDRNDLRAALTCTAKAATVDPVLDLKRAQAEVRLGHVAEGLLRAESLVARHADRRPMLRILYADVLSAAGRPTEAREQLLLARADLVRRALPTAEIDHLIATFR